MCNKYTLLHPQFISATLILLREHCSLKQNKLYRWEEDHWGNIPTNNLCKFHILLTFSTADSLYVHKHVSSLAAQLLYKRQLMIDNLLRAFVGHISQKW